MRLRLLPILLLALLIAHTPAQERKPLSTTRPASAEPIKVKDEEYHVYTLKYATQKAREKATEMLRAKFAGTTHVLTEFGPFVDVFVRAKDGGAAQRAYSDKKKTGFEWEEYVTKRPLPPQPPLVEATTRAVKKEPIIADARDRVGGKTGKGVLLAIIDSGIDFELEDFIEDVQIKVDEKLFQKPFVLQKRSRLLYYWDTTQKENPSAGDVHCATKLTATYPDKTIIGALYSREFLSTVIQYPKQYGKEIQRDVDRDVKGEYPHGTACAVVAVGRGNARFGTKEGVAPGADLIFVRVAEKYIDNKGEEKIRLNTYLLNAICEWLERVAQKEGKPLVISLSQGTGWGGGYDGMRGQDQHLNARFSLEKEKRAICMCAGNEGRGKYNTRVILDPKGPKTIISWNAQRKGGLVFYFDTKDPNDIGVKILGKQAELVWKNRIFHAPSKTWRTDEFQIDPGQGEVTLQATGNSKVTVDAYILSGDSMDNQGSIRSDQDPDSRKVATMRINSPATIPNAITVGSYDWSNEFKVKGDEKYYKVNVGELSDYSSPGPRRWPTSNKEPTPWLVAPGQIYTVSKPGGGLLTFNGTSAATPYTAGFLALMFECKKDLKFGDIRRLLAEPDALTKEGTDKDALGNRLPPVPNSHWGYGKLDLPAAEAIIKKLLDKK